MSSGVGAGPTAANRYGEGFFAESVWDGRRRLAALETRTAIYGAYDLAVRVADTRKRTIDHLGPANACSSLLTLNQRAWEMAPARGRTRFFSCYLQGVRFDAAPSTCARGVILRLTSSSSRRATSYRAGRGNDCRSGGHNYQLKADYQLMAATKMLYAVCWRVLEFSFGDRTGGQRRRRRSARGDIVDIKKGGLIHAYSATRHADS